MAPMTGDEWWIEDDDLAPDFPAPMRRQIALKAADELVTDQALGKLVRRLLAPAATRRDEYQKLLEEVVRQQAPRPNNVVDLMGWLEESVRKRRVIDPA